MFEAIHGSAPRIAGQNKANPSGLLLGAIQMLVHIGQTDVAEKIQNAWLKTLEEGVHTYDIYKDGTSKEKLGTQEFADAVISRLGQKPDVMKPVDYSKSIANFNIKVTPVTPSHKELVGVDVFLHFAERDANKLAGLIKDIESSGLQLTMITNRGTKVWPDGFPETFCTDHWRCRYKNDMKNGVSYQAVLEILQRIHNRKMDIIKTENLYLMNGVPMFTAGQGQ
jgi:isocitrate dehydrogenase